MWNLKISHESNNFFTNLPQWILKGKKIVKFAFYFKQGTQNIIRIDRFSWFSFIKTDKECKLANKNEFFLLFSFISVGVLWSARRIIYFIHQPPIIQNLFLSTKMRGVTLLSSISFFTKLKYAALCFSSLYSVFSYHTIPNLSLSQYSCWFSCNKIVSLP